MAKDFLRCMFKLAWHGALPNVNRPYKGMTWRGYTPLTFAAVGHNKDLLDCLLENGADVNRKDEYGNTALIYAVGSSLEMVEALLKKHADTNVRQGNKPHGDTPLIRAIHQDPNTRDAARIVTSLLNKEANPNLQDEYDRTALLLSINNNDLEDNRKIVLDLLEHKADPNIPDNDGYTPLMICRDEELFRALLMKNANIEARNKDGNFALELARARRLEKIVQILEEEGERRL